MKKLMSEKLRSRWLSIVSDLAAELQICSYKWLSLPNAKFEYP